MTAARVDLVFELERGGADTERDAMSCPAAAEAPLRVWRIDAALSPCALAQRFGAEWAAWYGPELAGAAGRIARLLARPPASTASPHEAATRLPLPQVWVVPLVRRRRRQLAIWLPASAPADAPASGAGGGDRLTLELQLYWGATSKPGVAAGRVVWQPCALREQASCATVAWPATTQAQLLSARQLRGGVGLLVARPWLLPGPGPGSAPAAGATLSPGS
jgi:hypothetical protein